MKKIKAEGITTWIWIIGIVVAVTVFIILVSGSFSNFFKNAGEFMSKLFKMVAVGG